MINKKKAFPNFAKVTTDFEAFKKQADKLGTESQSLKTPNGKIYGAKLPDGTIFINPQNLNANTPIHEFSHLWKQVIKVWAKGLEVFKDN